jgi:hypothetical protein
MTTKARLNTAPWLREVWAGRPPSKDELAWMIRTLLTVQELEDEYALRNFQKELDHTLGTILPEIKAH